MVSKLIWAYVTNSQYCLLVVDKFWIFENFFDMPVGLLCARIVDCVDKQVVMAQMYCVLITLCTVSICLC